MPELKTRPGDASVTEFLLRVPDERRRADSFAVLEVLREVTGHPPTMWGEGMVGFGRYMYRYASGHQGEWPLLAFAPRKSQLTIYVSLNLPSSTDLLAQLGKHTHGTSCLHCARLSDLHLPTLRALLEASVAHTMSAHGDAHLRP